MQGIQSSITPEKTEKCGPALGPDLASVPGFPPEVKGPLEAAKRYFERQREKRAVISVEDDDDVQDDRPEWLRHWPNEGQGDARSLPETAAGADTNTNTSTGMRKAPTSAPATHVGQSIEAAFAFETLFHFETEFEAESTEDWLDLSDSREDAQQPKVEESTLRHTWRDIPSTVGQAAAPINGAQASRPFNGAVPMEMGPVTTDRSGGGRTGLRGEASETAPLMTMPSDPQAVRAAIFRLAQSSTNQGLAEQQFIDRMEERSGEPAKDLQKDRQMGKVEMTNAASPSEREELVPLDDQSPAYVEPHFAEVARKLWNRPGDASVQNSALEEAMLLPIPTELVTGDREVDVTGEGLRRGEISVADLSAERSSVAAAPAHRMEDLVHDPDSNRQCGLRGAEELRGANDPIGSYAAIPIPVSEAVAGERVSGGKEPRALLDSQTSHPGPTVTSAGDGPALAHDAGNLLSALKLYSELLALSGVLHARHSHYAQDLKLLAARSEVLIDRLLCSLRHADGEGGGLVPVAAEGLAHSKANQLPQSHPKASAQYLIGSPAREPAHYREQAASSSQLAGTGQQPAPAAVLDRGVDVVMELNQNHSGDSGSASRDAAVAMPERRASWTGAPRRAADQVSATGTTTAERAPLDHVGTGQSTPRQLFPITSDQGTALAPLPTASEVAVSPNEAISVAPGVNLIELLTRWGGLLAMIARGPVQVNFGPMAALPIQVDEEAMERILVNLVHNAMMATRAGGKIRIGVGRSENPRPGLSDVDPEPGGLEQSVSGPLSAAQTTGEQGRSAETMVVTVDDSGCGMNEEQVAKLLGNHHIAGPAGDPGEVAASHRYGVDRPGVADRTDRRGHGMGVQIVRKLVAASGGEFAIYSRPGVGTRIEIRWPTLKSGIGENNESERILPSSARQASSAAQHSFNGAFQGAIAC